MGERTYSIYHRRAGSKVETLVASLPARNQRNALERYIAEQTYFKTTDLNFCYREVNRSNSYVTVWTIGTNYNYQYKAYPHPPKKRRKKEHGSTAVTRKEAARVDA